jgi:26S proteasome regulatory subunit N1
VNLALTYVNAFVNAGFKKDALMSVKDVSWFTKVKNDSVTAAVAGIGLTHMWNQDTGTNEISPYLEFSDVFSKGGSCLGIGISCTGLVDDSDPAIALLRDYINDKE